MHSMWRGGIAAPAIKLQQISYVFSKCCLFFFFIISTYFLPVLSPLLTIKNSLFMLHLNFAVNMIDWENVLVTNKKTCEIENTNDM